MGSRLWQIMVTRQRLDSHIDRFVESQYASTFHDAVNTIGHRIRNSRRRYRLRFLL
jgi:hypothetical protein